MNTNVHMKLVRGLRSGSYEDFDKLYTIYSDLLYGFVLELTKSPTEAKDILQETFLRVWLKRESVSLELSFKSYLYSIARNLIIDSFRKQMKSVAFEEFINSNAYQTYADNSVEKHINYDDFCEKLNKAKCKLTERQLQIFELSREKGFSITLIAQKLHISEKTVKNQLTLALKIIRTELADYYFLLLFFL